MKPLKNLMKNENAMLLGVLIVCILVSHEEINNVPVETKSFNLS